MRASVTILAILLAATALPAAEATPQARPAERTGGSAVGSPPGGVMLTADELAKFYNQALTKRLDLERQQVAQEMSANPLLDAGKVQAAVKLLQAPGPDTVEANLDVISRAYALVDERFAAAAALLADKPAQAVQAFTSLIGPEEVSYLAAAERLGLAKALHAAGQVQESVDALVEMVSLMPQCFSFSSAGLLQAGTASEKLKRNLNALGYYKLWLKAFGEFDPATAAPLARTCERIASDYKDPLGTVADKMGQAAGQLSHADTGQTTQSRQGEIVDLLADLIATAQDKDNQDSSDSSSQQDKKRSQGEKSGQKQPSGAKQPAPAGGIPNNPSSPAKAAILPTGHVGKPEGLSEVRPSDPSDDWGKLPPRQREQLLEGFQQPMPERYRDMIRDYYKGLSEQRK